MVERERTFGRIGQDRLGRRITGNDDESTAGIVDDIEGRIASGARGHRRGIEHPERRSLGGQIPGEEELARNPLRHVCIHIAGPQHQGRP